MSPVPDFYTGWWMEHFAKQRDTFWGGNCSQSITFGATMVLTGLKGRESFAERLKSVQCSTEEQEQVAHLHLDVWTSRWHGNPSILRSNYCGEVVTKQWWWHLMRLIQPSRCPEVGWELRKHATKMEQIKRQSKPQSMHKLNWPSPNNVKII